MPLFSSVRSGVMTLLAVTALAGSAHAGEQRIAASAPAELQAWGARLEQMRSAGDARLVWSREDQLVSGRQHQRFAQLYKGVPVYGGQLVVQTNARGVPVSVFGTVYDGIDLDTRALLSSDQALGVVRGLGFKPFGRYGQPALMVLPRSAGGYDLVYRIRGEKKWDFHLFFVDARSGGMVKDLRDVETATAVGVGTGVLGDRKKISANSVSGGFSADDKLRPPRLATYDYHGDFRHLIEVPDFFDADLATDSDNTWTDGADVDAHAYSGYTYDYYFKRFGRRGLDDADLHLRNITHAVSRDDIFQYPDDVIFSFYLNAFYAGDGIMVYGEGLPEGLTFNGQYWDYLAGGLDVVGHELTHGVTDYSSQLIYEGESGALNESFSDMMGTSVEFFFQPDKGDYILGEDVITPGGLRSMAHPGAFGDPEHYSQLFRGQQDNGGVHTNSGIPNNAFYLAIEGGRNRVSGAAVSGVGGANREVIEKVFYRGFVEMLPPNANFHTARAATIQAARDLYGGGSAAETAVTQAWTAVGVN